MAEERDIEKQLRAAAEQRRREAGAPFELHPATRRLLQDEVRRAHPRPAGAAERTSLFASWWFRIAATACVVVVAAALFLPVLSSSKSRSRQLAQNLELREKEIAGPAQNRPALPPAESAPAPAAAPPSRDDTDKDRLAATREIARDEAAAKSSTAVATNGIAPGMATGVSTLAFAAQSGQQNLFFRNAGVPADIGQTHGGQLAGELDKADLKRSLNDQTKVVAGKIPLATFQMEQTGNRIRITDSDGSVYNGDLTVADTETPAATASAPPAITAGEPEKQFEQPARQKEMLPLNNSAWQQNQNFRFNAIGTNLSLNQRVTISGEFIAATNPAILLGATQNGGVGGVPSQSVVNQSQPLSNGRIVGKAVLDNGQEILLNAIPAAP